MREERAAPPSDQEEPPTEEVIYEEDGEQVIIRRAASTPVPALDVERLAKAIYAADLVEPVTFSVKTVDSEAERIAAEYERLSRTEDRGTRPVEEEQK